MVYIVLLSQFSNLTIARNLKDDKYIPMVNALTTKNNCLEVKDVVTYVRLPASILKSWICCDSWIAIDTGDNVTVSVIIENHWCQSSYITQLATCEYSLLITCKCTLASVSTRKIQCLKDHFTCLKMIVDSYDKAW